jgi:hypothetical protein
VVLPANMPPYFVIDDYPAMSKAYRSLPGKLRLN